MQQQEGLLTESHARQSLLAEQLAQLKAQARLSDLEHQATVREMQDEMESMNSVLAEQSEAFDQLYRALEQKKAELNELAGQKPTSEELSAAALDLVHRDYERQL